MHAVLHTFVPYLTVLSNFSSLLNMNLHNMQKRRDCHTAPRANVRLGLRFERT